MRFVWFWTFWHWSKESFRVGALLRSPLQGVGGHWDEWFRHEASEEDLGAIHRAGASVAAQRQFIAWLVRHWAREVGSSRNRLIPRFVLAQLAQVAPFNTWTALEKYRAGYGIGGISSVVLAEGSLGEAEDVRPVEAIVLLSEDDKVDSKVLAEGFQVAGAELNTARESALSLLRGKGLACLLMLWLVSGRRPYPGWLRITLALGWMLLGGLIAYLLVGPDPDESLFLVSGTLTILWVFLIVIATSVAGMQIAGAWRQGRCLSDRLERSHLRLRMNGGFQVKGGSAGLAFCLNTLLSLYRAFPPDARPSWLWRIILRRLNAEPSAWAATGIVTSEAWLKPVVLDSKLRACLQQITTKQILTPRQPDAQQHVLDRLASAMIPARSQVGLSSRGAALGFAAEGQRLRIHRCSHIAQSLLAIGGLYSRSQTLMNFAALALSAIMLIALPDLSSILLLHEPPAVVAPSSASPRFLWVSLDTTRSRYFKVVFESEFWANRQANVHRYSDGKRPARAEILLRRLSRPAWQKEDARIWVERRFRFLNREYAVGERVGCYSLGYVSSLGQE